MNISIATTSIADIAKAFNEFQTLKAAEDFFDDHDDDIAGIVKAAVPEPTAENIRAKFRKELNCKMPIHLAQRIANAIVRLNRAATPRPAKVQGRIAALHE